MSNRKKPYGKEYEELVGEYHKATHKEKADMATRLGVSPATLKNWASEGDTPPQEKAEPKEAEVVFNIPPIKILKYKTPRRGRGDPETQVLLLGDHHADEITPTYNEAVYKERVEKIFEGTLTITELHRNMYPINDLVIFMLGDMVHGENPFQGAKVSTIKRGGTEQVFDLALPTLLSLLSSFRENFRSVKVYCVWGNHGKISREAPRTSNWDNTLYQALDIARKPAGIDIYPPTDFCQLVTVNGFRFFAYHGDQINISNGIPYFAQVRKLMSWYFNYNGFAYAVQGHFHKDDLIRATSKIKGFINGAIVTDDPFALEKVGTSGIPCQWTMGVHERQGVTWTYSLILDDKFLPERTEV